MIGCVGETARVSIEEIGESVSLREMVSGKGMRMVFLAGWWRPVSE